jgi:hypothetical protein
MVVSHEPFLRCLYTKSTGIHGGFASAPFEKPQLIQFLSKN